MCNACVCVCDPADPVSGVRNDPDAATVSIQDEDGKSYYTPQEVRRCTVLGLSVCLPICLSVCMDVCLSVCLSVL